MLFPLFLGMEKVSEWILLTFLVILIITVSVNQKNKKEAKAALGEEVKAALGEEVKEALEEEVKEVIGEEAIEVLGKEVIEASGKVLEEKATIENETQENSPEHYTSEEEITLENLIDWGFKAKTEGRYQLAAEWFGRALALHPEPDLAIYLLMDIYWLWKASRNKDYAYVELKTLYKLYENELPDFLQVRFSNWLTKEKLDITEFLEVN